MESPLGRWSVASPDPVRRTALARDLDIHPITAQLLINRGIETTDAAHLFLQPSLALLPDPFSFPQMDLAIERIIIAIHRREQISLFGDYDVDGITGTALLTRFLRSVGLDPIVIVPHRLKDGYGMSHEKIVELYQRGTKLIITIDNGMRSHEEITAARHLGMDVIVTDHHEGCNPPTAATAVLNPRLAPKEFAARDLCGCGVAFFLALALRRRMREAGLLTHGEPNLKNLLDLVAIGTIADIVPLTGINRILTHFGILAMQQKARPAIAALLDVSRTSLHDIRAGTIAFRIAPRLNAAGRMDDPQIALKLLTTEDEMEARSLAKQLDELNAKRQRVEGKMVAEALVQAEAQSGEEAIVVAAPHWHIGVIGITAAKIAERFGKPAAVIGGEGMMAKGSLRSIRGLNILDCLQPCADLLTRFGGHAGAAGITIETSRIQEFQLRLSKACREKLTERRATGIRIDAEVIPADITEKLIEEIERFEPFGFGNPEPILCLHGLRMTDRRTVGERHLKFRAIHETTSFDAIGFNMATGTIDHIHPWSMAFYPEFNTWNGVRRMQLKIKDLVPHTTMIDS